MRKPEKLEVLVGLKEKLGQANAVILTDYQGLNVAQMTELRRNLRKQGVEYRVLKNRLTRIALKEAECESMDEWLVGPTGIAFGYGDPVVAAKVLAEFAKGNEKLSIKGGLIDGRKYPIEKVKQLAGMPAKEVLYGRILGSLQNPARKLAFGLQASIAKVAWALRAVADREEAA